jgi:type I restriction enzyme M protein
MLWGAIIGDIVGSIYEFDNIKTKDFPLFTERGFITDDSCMTIAVADALMKWKRDGGDLQKYAIQSMREIGRKYPNMGYGFRFARWLSSDDNEPYNSWGNGAAMRVSAVGWIGNSITEVKRLSYMVTAVSHDHIEGIKGAEATAVAIFMARTGKTKEEIAKYITDNYYDWCSSVAELQANYSWDGSCQGTVPPALQCFFESENFEDAIRNAISIGGDSDTIGAITGAVAGAYYGIPKEMIETARKYVPDDLLVIIDKFEKGDY